MHAPIYYGDKYPRNSAVAIGSTVVLRDLDAGEIETYTLVRPDEVDVVRNRISSFSPLGLALGGRCIGEIVEFEAPGGWVRLEIEDVFHDDETPVAEEVSNKAES